VLSEEIRQVAVMNMWGGRGGNSGEPKDESVWTLAQAAYHKRRLPRKAKRVDHCFAPRGGDIRGTGSDEISALFSII